ncbi:MAG: hypothetical protein M3Y91_18365 [Actinomycetota bacterium]|nr:hypothetical protein [Actinomycetota bacterium]
MPGPLAGVGSGVLTTMQQTSLALGVATLGGLYLTEAPAARLGPLYTSLVVLAVLMAISALVALCGRKLPD